MLNSGRKSGLANIVVEAFQLPHEQGHSCIGLIKAGLLADLNICRSELLCSQQRILLVDFGHQDLEAKIYC